MSQSTMSTFSWYILSFIAQYSHMKTLIAPSILFLRAEADFADVDAKSLVLATDVVNENIRDWKNLGSLGPDCVGRLTPLVVYLKQEFSDQISVRDKRKKKLQTATYVFLTITNKHNTIYTLHSFILSWMVIPCVKFGKLGKLTTKKI